MVDNIAKMTPKQLQAQRLADMRDIMVTEQGRRVIWELLETAGLMTCPPAGLDEGQTQRILGKKDIAHNIYEWVMEAAPASFLKMLQTRAQEMENYDG